MLRTRDFAEAGGGVVMELETRSILQDCQGL